MQNKTKCSPTFIFLNSFSLLTLLTNNITCKDDSSLNAKPPSLAQEMPTSSISWYWDKILKKYHYMLYPVPTFLLGICFGTARDGILGQTSCCLFLHVYVSCNPPWDQSLVLPFVQISFFWEEYSKRTKIHISSEKLHKYTELMKTGKHMQDP